MDLSDRYYARKGTHMACSDCLTYELFYDIKLTSEYILTNSQSKREFLKLVSNIITVFNTGMWCFVRNIADSLVVGTHNMNKVMGFLFVILNKELVWINIK